MRENEENNCTANSQSPHLCDEALSPVNMEQVEEFSSIFSVDILDPNFIDFNIEFTPSKPVVKLEVQKEQIFTDCKNEVSLLKSVNDNPEDVKGVNKKSFEKTPCPLKGSSVSEISQTKLKETEKYELAGTVSPNLGGNSNYA